MLFLKASLGTPDGDVRAFLRNISRSGALVDTNHDLAVGMPVTLHCHDLTIPARVAWAGEKRVGLEFRQPIEEEMVRALAGSRRG